MKNNIKALRILLKDLGLDGFLIPMDDPFQNEVVSPHFNRVRFISQFTGSAGVVLVLEDKAILFTDGRYTTQAHQEVDLSLFEVQGHWYHHIKSFLKGSLTIGFDPWTLTASHMKHLRSFGIKWIPCPENPVDQVWTDRPLEPWAPIKIHLEEFAGESSQSKRKKIGQAVKDPFVLTMGDSIAWLLNIRGGDVDGTPIPFSYGVIHTQGDMDLFIEPQKVSLDVSSFLGPNVTVHPLDHIIPFLRKFDQVGFDPKTTPEAIVEALNKGIEANDPCLLPRACKNTTEQEGARQCHVVDGVALTKFLYFLYHHHYEDGFDEAQAVIKLRSLRAIGKHYQGDSFETISATGPHSAWCHYHTKEHTNTSVKKGDLYLVDSGGQYLNGTTDVTRTIVIGGHGTPEQKDHYTRVLKGYIALDTIKFPKGTSGVHLDVLVRQYLWEVGLNFPHATGHGVGSYLSVHEGPQCITPRLVEAPLMPGMILSNEPGVYREGHYGIRLENLVLVRECPDLPGFLEFENLTWAPFDMNLIDMGMLSLKEKQWLKDYHQRLLRVLGDGLSFEEKEWVEHSFSVNEDKLI